MRITAADTSLVDGVLAVAASMTTPVVGLVGVVTGATVAALLARRNDTRKVVTDIRREVYFEVMDLAVGMYEQLTIISRNGPRGGSDTEADRAAGDAIDALVRLMPSFIRAEARVATVGSILVSEATYEFRQATNKYMLAIFDEHGAGQIFRVGVAALHLAGYATTLDRLARAIRSDLGLEPLGTALPVTREALERAARLPSAGWYPDPTGRYEFRWWNGAYWDETVSRLGEPMKDESPIRTVL